MINLPNDPKRNAMPVQIRVWEKPYSKHIKHSYGCGPECADHVFDHTGKMQTP
jgi:hypothetical protein